MSSTESVSKVHANKINKLEERIIELEKRCNNNKEVLSFIIQRPLTNLDKIAQLVDLKVQTNLELLLKKGIFSEEERQEMFDFLSKASQEVLKKQIEDSVKAE